MLRRCRQLICALLLGSAMQTIAQDLPAIVLIIDDLGNSRENSLRTVNLTGDVTCAVLPHTPNAKLVAEHAHKQNKEVIIHLPMSSVHGKATGPGGLHEQQSTEDFQAMLRSDLAAVPFAVGVNNHMGSSLTQNASYMQLVMEEISDQELYFIDSRTSSRTVAAKVAGANQIQHLSRDVFLDNSQRIEDIHTQFLELLAKARKTGLAIGIGHPYPSTLDYLESVLPTLEITEGVRIISGSEAVRQRYSRPAALASNPAFDKIDSTIP